MYIQLNGQILFYEKYGEGSPVILVHGNGETHDIFDALIPVLAKQHTVYAPDSRGHGLSATPKELHYADMAEDMANFIQVLDIQKPAFLGFSDGGIVGLLLASKYPDMISSLVVAGANLQPKDLKRSLLWRMKRAYRKSKDPLAKLMLTEPDIAPERLAFISVPTLVLAGQKDIVQPAATKQIADSIAGSILEILPKETHTSYVVHSAALAPQLLEFFNS